MQKKIIAVFLLSVVFYGLSMFSAEAAGEVKVLTMWKEKRLISTNEAVEVRFSITIYNGDNSTALMNQTIKNLAGTWQAPVIPREVDPCLQDLTLVTGPNENIVVDGMATLKAIEFQCQLDASSTWIWITFTPDQLLVKQAELGW